MNQMFALHSRATFPFDEIRILPSFPTEPAPWRFCYPGTPTDATRRYFKSVIFFVWITIPSAARL